MFTTSADDRRSILALLIPAVLLFSIGSVTAATSSGGVAIPEFERPVPMIHVTDLFRPHDDPDDHWDLASVFAMAYLGHVDLLGILIDYPKPQRRNDPDVLAVAQLNFLTGKAIPVAIGAASPYGSSGEEADLLGVRTMLRWMESSPEPVVINVLGSCRDVAIAAQLAPELFSAKCKAVFLNAGSGTPNPVEAKRPEWNVQLDPQSYVAMFELPCTVYWMPCFQVVYKEPDRLFRVGEYGTFYRFRQTEILPFLSGRIQRFFSFMYAQGRFVPESQRVIAGSQAWLSALYANVSPELTKTIGEMSRNMWCTAGFLQSIGKTVSREGQVVSLKEARDPVYEFEAIEVSCSSEAITRWHPGAQNSRRFLFHVLDQTRYASAMTKALRTLLRELP